MLTVWYFFNTVNSNEVSFKLLKDNMELNIRRQAVKEGEDKEVKAVLSHLGDVYRATALRTERRGSEGVEVGVGWREV